MILSNNIKINIVALLLFLSSLSYAELLEWDKFRKEIDVIEKLLDENAENISSYILLSGYEDGKPRNFTLYYGSMEKYFFARGTYTLEGVSYYELGELDKKKTEKILKVKDLLSKSTDDKYPAKPKDINKHLAKNKKMLKDNNINKGLMLKIIKEGQFDKSFIVDLRIAMNDNRKLFNEMLDLLVAPSIELKFDAPKGSK